MGRTAQSRKFDAADDDDDKKKKKNMRYVCVCVCVFYFCSVRQRTESTKIKTTHEFTFFNYLDFRKQEKSTFHLITFQSR